MVKNPVDWVTVTGTKNDANATLSAPVTLGNLVMGVPQTAKITVTAQDGTVTTYTITVTRAAPASAPPPTPTDLLIGQTTANTVQFTWTGSNDADSYKLYRSLSASGVFTCVRDNVTIPKTADAAGLSANTSYYYKVSAVNALGESTLGPMIEAKTLALTGSLPSAPQSLTAGPATTETVSFSWAPVTGAAGYRVYRAATVSGVFAPLDGETASLLFTDKGLPAGKMYYYKVAAYNGVGQGDLSGSIAVSTSIPVTPVMPTGLVVGATAQTTLALSWNRVTGATGYNLFRATASGTFSLVSALGANTSFTDTGLTPAVTYSYKVSATNAAGEGPVSTAATGTTLAVPTIPAIPTGLTAVTATTTTLSLSWSPVTNATGYRLYRSATSTGTYTKVGGDLTAASYTDTGLAASTTYFYKVTAYNAAGESAQTAATTGTTASALTVPSTPTNLVVGTATTTTLSLSWSPVTNATGYRLYRSATSTGTYTKVGGDPTAASYTDTGLAASTTYFYKVTAYNAAGESAQTAATTGTTAGASPQYRGYRTNTYDKSGALIQYTVTTFLPGTNLASGVNYYGPSGALVTKTDLVYLPGTNQVEKMNMIVDNAVVTTILFSYGPGTSRPIKQTSYDASNIELSRVEMTYSGDLLQTTTSYVRINGVETLRETGTFTYNGTKQTSSVFLSTTVSGAYTVSGQTTQTFTYTGDLQTEAKLVSIITAKPSLAGYPLTQTAYSVMTYDAMGNLIKQVQLDQNRLTTLTIENLYETF